MASTQSPIDDSMIKLKVVDQISNETYFRMKMSTKLERLKKTYAERIGFPVSSLKFIFRDQRRPVIPKKCSLGKLHYDEDEVCVLASAF